MDKRFEVFIERLNDLSTEEVLRIKNNIDLVCFDTFNYDKNNHKYCPLAIALNLHKTIDEPTDEKITTEIGKKFQPVNALKDVEGKFYTNNRKDDLLKVCDFVLKQKNMKPIFIAEIKTNKEGYGNG